MDLNPSPEDIEALVKAKHPNALDDALSEVQAKSDTLAAASSNPPPTAADTVMLMVQTKTAQQFLTSLVALCMQAEHDNGEVMFVSKRGRARFTVHMNIRHKQRMTFIGEGENLFVASANLHNKIMEYMHAGHSNPVPTGDSPPAAEAGDAGAGEVAPPADAPAAP